MAIPGRHKKFELLQLKMEWRQLCAVVPFDDALGCVTAAEEAETDVRAVVRADFAGDFEKEPGVGDGDGEAWLVSGGREDEFQALIE